MLRLKTIPVDRYLELLSVYFASDMSSLRSFYATRDCTEVSFRGEPIAVFCLNDRPEFRCLQIVRHDPEMMKRVPDLQHCMELVGVGIDTKYRGGWVSSLVWLIMTVMAMRTGKRYFLCGTVEPRLYEYYASSGAEPAIVTVVDYMHKERPFYLFALDVAKLPQYTARLLLARVVKPRRPVPA